MAHKVLAVFSIPDDREDYFRLLSALRAVVYDKRNGVQECKFYEVAAGDPSAAKLEELERSKLRVIGMASND